MKRFTITILAMVFAMGMPMAALAMDHSAHAKEMSHDKQSDDHGMKMGHDMGQQNDDFVEIGKDTQKGVVATVKIKTYDEKTLASMAKMGMSGTHHVMVFFTDEKSGGDITSGKVAIKVKGQEGKPAMMMLMGEGFGSDVSLTEMMTTFQIGTKLDDGKKRQFAIMFHNM